MKYLLLVVTLVISTMATNFAAAAAKIVAVTVTEKGFEPSTVKVAPGEEVILNITRKTDSTCARDVLFPATKLKKELPLNKTVSINLGVLKKGDINFSCGMDMVKGIINVQ